MTCYRLAALVSLFPAVLSGCAGLPNTETRSFEHSLSVTHVENMTGQSAPQQGYHQMQKAATLMLEGIRLYEKGDYQDAIAKFTLPEIGAAPIVFRVEALKYTAFSYCVLEVYAYCRLAFDQALRIDADFDLLASESGHPMWGPVFEAAKSASQRGRVRVPAGRERLRWQGIDPWRPK